mgnify:CR=1 FL=1
MALSERERQLLEQLEQQLNVEDPTFADTMQEERPRPRPGAGLSGRNLVLGIVVAVLGLGLVLLGVATQLIIVGVLGFLVMAGGVYLATLRRREGGAGPRSLVTAQLCHGRCPVLDVAADHPELCEAETDAFSRLLGVHVQRLATLAQGDHVCTTFVPTAGARPHTERSTR